MVAEILDEIGPQGQRGFIVEYEDNFGSFRERFFTSRRAAEKFALNIEMDLLNETVADFNAAIAAMTPRQFEISMSECDGKRKRRGGVDDRAGSMF